MCLSVPRAGTDRVQTWALLQGARTMQMVMQVENAPRTHMVDPSLSVQRRNGQGCMDEEGLRGVEMHCCWRLGHLTASQAPRRWYRCL